MLARKLIIAGFGALALCMTGLAYAAVARVSTHLSGTDCGACHLNGSNVDLARASQLMESQEKLCSACHERAMQFSHPSGFAPGRSLPAEYPLDGRGYLTCSTCHLPHGFEPGLVRGKKRARDFCLTCHDQAFVNGMKDAGASLVISGHLDIGSGRGTAEMDAYSRHCLGCHVGDHSGGVAISLSRGGIARSSNHGGPHPIGGSYDDASRRKSGLLPEYLLAQRNIRLPDGRLSCVSCHQAYTKDHGKLAVSLDRSALCLSCHAK